MICFKAERVGSKMWGLTMGDNDLRAADQQHGSAETAPYAMLEWYTFSTVMGPVDGLHVLDAACGDGHLSRRLMALGAGSVVGVDLCELKIARARQQNRPRRAGFHKALQFETVDVRDGGYRLEAPADLVTGMYLFQYAGHREELFRMCRFLGRNLRTGGRFIGYSINPDYDFTHQYPFMEDVFGFRYRIVEPPEYRFVSGDVEVPVWQWSRADHETGLRDAGFANVQWHPLRLPDEHRDLSASVNWYLENPSYIVVSAEKTVD